MKVIACFFCLVADEWMIYNLLTNGWFTTCYSCYDRFILYLSHYIISHHKNINTLLFFTSLPFPSLPQAILSAISTKPNFPFKTWRSAVSRYQTFSPQVVFSYMRSEMLGSRRLISSRFWYRLLMLRGIQCNKLINSFGCSNFLVGCCYNWSSMCFESFDFHVFLHIHRLYGEFAYSDIDIIT